MATICQTCGLRRLAQSWVIRQETGYRASSRSHNIRLSGLPLAGAAGRPQYPPRPGRQFYGAASWRSTSDHSTSNSSSIPDAPKTPRRPSPYRLLPPHLFLSQFAPLHVRGWRLDSQSSDSANSRCDLDGEVGAGADGTQGETADLQDRRLVRVYDFPKGKEGWRAIMAFAGRIAEVVEREDVSPASYYLHCRCLQVRMGRRGRGGKSGRGDEGDRMLKLAMSSQLESYPYTQHHPTIVICPVSDHTPTSLSLSVPDDPTSGYILELSTHTHTPLPPIRTQSQPQPLGSASNGGATTKMRPGVTGKDLKLAERIEEVFQELIVK